MKLILPALCAVVCLGFQAGPKRLFIEERVLRNNRNVTAQLTRDILKQCPGTITVTTDPQSPFTLKIQPGSSVLYSSGGAVQTFKAKHSVSNLAKDVCEFMGNQ